MTFRAGIRIPADLLNELPYEARIRLRVTSMTDPDLEPVVAADETLSFSVMNPHPERSVWNEWPFGRPGLVSPRLTWTAERQAPQ